MMGADGKQVWHRRLPNRLDAVLTALAPFRPALMTVAIESTYNWYWLADGLEDAGYRVVLANPARMDQYQGLKTTDDDSDATFIAELCRLGILPTGWICPREERARRDLRRRRMLVVESRTCQVNSLQGLLIRQTGAAAKYALLTSTPGVGKILAMTMMLEIGDIRRFAGPGDLSSYVRAVKAERLSNGKVKGKNNGRNGNRYLSWAFIEAVNHAARCCEPARKWYQRKAAATLPVVARKALASKFAKAVWYMLTENKPFQIEKVFG